jgi:hypothetical protein
LGRRRDPLPPSSHTTRRAVPQRDVPVFRCRSELRSVDYSPAGLRALVMAVGTSGPYLRNKPSHEASVQPVRKITIYPLVTGSALRSKPAATMASADFCHRIRTPLDALSHSRQHGRSPRVLRTHHQAYACRIYVAAFRARIGLYRDLPAHPAAPPLSASCSSGQRFAYSFLQIPPHDGHPCSSANTPPCRACRGLAPASECALRGAQTQRTARAVLCELPFK